MGWFGFGDKREAPAPVQKFYTAVASVAGSTKAAWTTYMGRVLYEEAYRTNTWVQACIRKRMTAAGSVPIEVQRKSAEGDWEAVDDHRLSALLEKPCPGMTRADLIETIAGQLDIQGNFYAKVVLGGRGGAIPLEIWPLPIGTVEPVVRGLEIVRYKFTPEGSGQCMDLASDEVLHLAYTNPDGPIGLSPLIAAGKAIDIDNEAAEFQKISMQNRGVPDGLFTLDADDEDDDVDAFERVRRRVREQYATRDSAREPWVLSRVKFQKMSENLADLDFMQGRGMTRQEICSALDVPMPMVGIYEDATLANIETARKIFWRDSVVPLLSSIQDALTRALVPAFDRNGRTRIRFDLSNVRALQESTQEKITAATALHAIGVPLAEVNRRFELGLELDDVSGAEEAMVPTSVAPVAPADAGRAGDKGLEAVMAVSERVTAGEMTPEAGALLLDRAVEWLDRETAAEILSSGFD